MNKNFKLKIFAILTILFFFENVDAAILDIKTKNNVLKQDEVFSVSIDLDTKGDYVNTIEGDLVYDSKAFTVELFDLSSSIINLWVEKPSSGSDGVIHFSGMTPGGVSVSKGNIFNVIFRAKKAGESNIALGNYYLYLNDGLGTKVDASARELSLVVGNDFSSNNTLDIFKDDQNPPEKFSIERARDSSMYEGGYFVVFNPIDKDSGISRVRVCEFFVCRDSGSPHLLSNQTSFYFVKITAFDMNNNKTSVFMISNFVYVALSVLIIFIFGLFLKFKIKNL